MGKERLLSTLFNVNKYIRNANRVDEDLACYDYYVIYREIIISPLYNTEPSIVGNKTYFYIFIHTHINMHYVII